MKKTTIALVALAALVLSPCALRAQWSLSFETDHKGKVEGFALAGKDKVTIDWGDGSAPQTVQLKPLPENPFMVERDNGTVSHQFETSGTKTVTVTGYNVTGVSTGKLRLRSLDVREMPSLEWINCDGAGIGELDLSESISLKWLSCNRNDLTRLELDMCRGLRVLHCQDNSLSSLDFRGNPRLYDLACDRNPLDKLNTMRLPLTELSCSACNLTTLDLSWNEELERLVCFDNALTSIVIGLDNDVFQFLLCANNALDRDALAAILEALPRRDAKPRPHRIRITDNPGYAKLSNSDKAVATDKGWELLD